MYCLDLYVSGIDIRATEYQVLSYFRCFSDDVQKVHLIKTVGHQNAIVCFSRPDTIEDVIQKVNFKVVDGMLLKCHLNEAYTSGAIQDEGTKVVLQFPANYNMDVLNHRNIFEIMEACGPILNIQIRKDLRKVFVQFISQKSAEAALSASCDCDVHIYQNKSIKKPNFTKDMFKPYVPNNKEKKPLLSESEASKFPSKAKNEGWCSTFQKKVNNAIETSVRFIKHAF